MNKKRLNKIIVSFLLILIALIPNVFAIEIKELEYTKEYKEYLELTDEEKKKVLQPRKYEVDTTEGFNKTLLKNTRITSKNLYSLLKSEATYRDATFDLRTIISNNIKIKNQMQTNMCWAFTSISSLETNLALRNYHSKTNLDKVYDFSERHMAYSMSQSFESGQNKYGWDKAVSDGGHMLMATSYLTNGMGAISETDMEFVNNESNISLSTISGKTVKTTVEDTIMFEGISMDDMAKLTTDTTVQATYTKLKEEIKQHIITSGSVYAGIHVPSYSEFASEQEKEAEDKLFNDANSAYYCNNASKSANHGVSIIGWDDNFSKDKFTCAPSNNGAWIIRNSWGETLEELLSDYVEANPTIPEADIIRFLQEEGAVVENGKVIWPVGDKGYFYVSYEDFCVYTNLWGIVSAKDEVTYDSLYQHDELGAGNGTANALNGTGDTYLANVFTRTSTQEEYLTAVGLDCPYSAATYEVYVNAASSDKATLTKVELLEGDSISVTPGYHTFKFKNPVKLTGSSFVIVVKIKDEEGMEVFALEDKTLSMADPEAGQSYVAKGTSIENLTWYDIGDSTSAQTYLGNLCIKGLVKNEVSDTPSIPDTPDVPDTPDTPDTPDIPDTPDVPDIPDTPDTPDVPDTPDTPDVPDTPDTPEEPEKAKSSDFSKATATMELKSFSWDMLNNTLKFEIELKIDNIKVEDLCDKYGYYYYLSDKANLTEVPASKWNKTTSTLVKNSNGTYSLTIMITEEKVLEDAADGDVVYVYMKEEATKGTDVAIKEMSPIEIEIKTVGEDDGDPDDKEQIPGNDTYYDGTVAPGILPNAGAKYITLFITIVFIIGGFAFVRYRNLKDVK